MPRGTDRYDEARLQGRLWTPNVEPPEMWFKARPGAFTYATGISQWNDLSGHGWHAVQATAGSQPTYQAQGFNGRPCVRFAGAASTQHFTLPSIAATGWTSLSALYVWRLNADPGSGNDAGALVSAFGSDASTDHEPYTDGVVYHGFGASARKTTGDPALSLASPRIVGINSAANDWSYWIDGGQHYATATNTVSLNVSATPFIARSGSFYVAGDAAEILVFSKAMTARQRQLREGYLAWEHGLVESNLAVSHPFKNRPPLIGD